ncbi:ATP-binding protein [Megalodesulfovibrio gigas]|uniref:Putative 4Fe-4S ferredoxin, iron-sulfur binding protein n=1 Tax=Megalodesulfovibrio gigas (strain ATCC 19364 / DSM 1382 / NCIMB 9332 / VKM B-1759) TaxID=1121448 RepID=T2GA76_MEGG1|nr:4Fe-4S dicluster domain-containing protein [Megalodesulfovibrio gigas]AGW13183.1 putative 4Fe-4S ferredoxin, iron-sulfur binding protein [Megalodesulfovibrio gigas DSM 1382 = ATCC 19364]
MKVTRKIIEINEDLCNGCGACVPGCAEAALQIIDGKAKLVAELYCDGLGACLGHCPTGALQVVEREAEEFNEEAVHERIETLKEPQAAPAPRPASMPCGCPGSMERSFAPRATPAPQAAPQTVSQAVSQPAPQASALTHWPIKLELVRPEAPFLQGAHLLVAADCAPGAAGDFHSTHLHGRVLTLGCPKFGPAAHYQQKLAAILKTARPASVTVLRMEVPCCAGLAGLVDDAVRLSGYTGPVAVQVLALDGTVKADGPDLAPFGGMRMAM